MTVPPVLAYGPEARQRLHWRALAGGGPVLAVIGGGAWAHNDPDGRFTRAATDWGHRHGMCVAIVEHRLLPEVDVLSQAEDVAHALVALRESAPRWQADPDRMLVLAHSAGAHLAALVHVGALRARVPGWRPWRASVLVDTAALDVPQLMQWPHAPLHDRAFGDDPLAWEAVSPRHQVQRTPAPVLLVASSERPGARLQARRFADAVEAAGGRAELACVDLAHHEMGEGLAAAGPLDAAIGSFLQRLDAAADQTESPSCEAPSR